MYVFLTLLNDWGPILISLQNKYHKELSKVEKKVITNLNSKFPEYIVEMQGLVNKHLKTVVQGLCASVEEFSHSILNKISRLDQIRTSFVSLKNEFQSFKSMNYFNDLLAMEHSQYSGKMSELKKSQKNYFETTEKFEGFKSLLFEMSTGSITRQTEKEITAAEKKYMKLSIDKQSSFSAYNSSNVILFCLNYINFQAKIHKFHFLFFRKTSTKTKSFMQSISMPSLENSIKYKSQNSRMLP